MVPLEQEAEQELQLDHSFHTPSTKHDQTSPQQTTEKTFVNIYLGHIPVPAIYKKREKKG